MNPSAIDVPQILSRTGLGLQRRRLLTALSELIEQRPFATITVADIVTQAHTSKRTFYDHFDDRVDCYITLADTINRGLVTHTVRSVPATETLTEWAQNAIAVYIDVVCTLPRLTLSLHRELPTLGERGIAMRRTMLTRFAQRIVDEAASGNSTEREVSFDAAMFIVSGLNEMISTAVEDRRNLQDLRATADQLVDLLAGSGGHKPAG